MNPLNWFKSYAQDFPTQGGGVVVALGLIAGTGLIVMVRLAFGKDFPTGYDTWIWALVALAGVTTAGMIGKRATDIDYQIAKNAAPPAPTPITTTTSSGVTSTTTTTDDKS